MGKHVNLKKINKFISEKFGFSDVSFIEKFKLGTGENYLMQDKTSKYLLKFFNNSNYEFPELEIKVCDLLKKELPVPKFLPMLDGNYIGVFDKKKFHVQEFISNVESARLNDFSLEELKYYTDVLGRIQKTLFSSSIVTNFKNGSLKKLEDPVKSLNNMSELKILIKNDEVLNNDISFKEKAINKYISSPVNLDKFSWVLSHGDYNPLQILHFKNNGGLAQICDFSRSSLTPASWEMLRFFSLGSKNNIDSIDFKRDFKECFSIYTNHIKLNDYEIKNMFKLLSSQINLSTFGYDLYNKIGDDTYKKLALKRTKMAMSLDKVGNDKSFIKDLIAINTKQRVNERIFFIKKDKKTNEEYRI